MKLKKAIASFTAASLTAGTAYPVTAAGGDPPGTLNGQKDPGLPACIAARPTIKDDVMQLLNYLNICNLSNTIAMTPEKNLETIRAGYAWIDYHYRYQVDMSLLDPTELTRTNIKTLSFSRDVANLRSEFEGLVARSEAFAKTHPPRTKYGADKSASLQCLSPSESWAKSVTTAAAFANNCAASYNSSRTSLSALNYGYGVFILAMDDFKEKRPGARERYATAKQFIAIGAAGGWPVNAKLPPILAQIDASLAENDRKQQLAQQKQSNDTNTGLIVTGIVAAGILAYLFSGGGSRRSSGNSSGRSSENDDADSRRAREDAAYEERNRRPYTPPPLPPEQPRTGGLYGNCPLPNAGYGC